MQYGHVEGLEKPISQLVMGIIPLMGQEDADAHRVLDAFVEAGGNAFDTANIYGGGEGNTSRILARWLATRPDRDRMVVLAKGCHPNRESSNFSVEALRREFAVELERLEQGFIDLWVFHRDDPTVDLEPIVAELNLYREQGKLGAFGGSNWTLERIVKTRRIAAAHPGWLGASLNNPNLSLATVNEPMWANCVTADLGMRAWHERERLPLFSWSSMGGGWFAGAEGGDIDRVYRNPENEARRERVRSLASDKGLSPAQIALAWVLGEPYPLWALVGCRTVEEAQQACAAAEVRLTAAERIFLEFGG